jgi:hypothetical protein
MREILNEIKSEQIMAGGIYKFGSLANARNFAGRTTKPMVIILGDDMLFWVVSLAMGEQLMTSGYEAAE